MIRYLKCWWKSLIWLPEHGTYYRMRLQPHQSPETKDYVVRVQYCMRHPETGVMWVRVQPITLKEDGCSWPPEDHTLFHFLSHYVRC